MARTKKASNSRQNRKAVVRQQESTATIAESVNNEAIGTTQTQSLTNHAIETSGTNNITGKLPNKYHRHPRTTTTNNNQLSSGELLDRPNGNFGESSDIINKKNVSTSSATNGEVSINDSSAITDDLEISGVASLMTDDSEASFVIDLTESVNETEENNGIANGSGQRQGPRTGSRKSIRKPLKRLVGTTITPRYDITKERTSKGTPYIRKVSSTNYSAKEMKFSTGKKERIAGAVKKSVNVKHVTFNQSPSMNVVSSSSAGKLNQPKSINKKQSAVKMPNFNDIHRKMFEKMESIDVTVRKREERRKAASSTKQNKGSSQEQLPADTTTKPKKVVRKLDNSQPDPSKILQAVGPQIGANKVPKSVPLKSVTVAPKVVEVLKERSNCDGVFKFTGTSDATVVSQPSTSEKTVENRSSRRQQAYKARPVPRTHPQNSDRLKGVRLNRRFQLQMKYRENQNELLP